MQIILNGETKDVMEGLTVQSLLDAQAIDARKVAVERNGTIVSKSLYAQDFLTDGDKIEIIGFIGGG